MCAVQRALGERVAGTVGLHVAAKRYLVATEGGYGGVLTKDSVVSLGRQGGAMDEEEVATFLARPWAADAVTLRRADDSGKVEGVLVGDLARWVPLLRELSRQSGAGRAPSATRRTTAPAATDRTAARLAPAVCTAGAPDRVGAVEVAVWAIVTPGSGPCGTSSSANSPSAARSAQPCASCSTAPPWSTWPAVGPSSGAGAWRHDTLVDFYSVGKAFVALLALQLVDEGRAGSRRPDRRRVAGVRRRRQGGGDVAARAVPPGRGAGHPHTAGRRRPVGLGHDGGALAATEPWWEPGTRHAYHTNTYGHLIGEVVRRVSGETCRDRLAAVVGPLDADVHVGVPPGEQHRCADVLFAAPGTSGRAGRLARGRRADGDAELLQSPGVLPMGVVNTPQWRGAEVPSTNGHGSARGVARLYAASLEPGRLLSADLLAEATSAQSSGYCPILHEDVTFGLGFKPTVPRRRSAPTREFGHFGTGGAVGFADPVGGVAFGYVMNHVVPRWQSTRTGRSWPRCTCR